MPRRDATAAVGAASELRHEPERSFRSAPLGPCLRLHSRGMYHALDAVDVEPGMPEAASFTSAASFYVS